MGDSLYQDADLASTTRQIRNGHLIFVHVGFNANTLINNIAVIRVGDGRIIKIIMKI